jgi:putative transposase
MAISDEMLDEFIGNAKTQEDVFGKNGIIKQLTKRLIERLLESEMTHHLGYKKHAIEGNNSGNSRNGKSRKKVKMGSGELEIEVPRDRNGEFQPVLVEKRQSRLKELDDNILSLYSHGMTNRDIQDHIKDLYGAEISIDLISTITDGVLEEVREWRNRPLDNIYAVVFIDGFVVKCRLDGVVSNRTVYVIYAITLEGKKEVLGLYLGETEGAKFWLYVLTELQNRGLLDIFILCSDGLKGLAEAVETTFPKTIHQTCIVHMVRHSLNYVPHAEKKNVASDLKKIYQANTLELALEAVDDFEITWGDKYPAIVKSWRNNWERVIPFLQFPKEIRKVIYTTNIVESLNNTLRKAVRNRGHFSTEDGLMKILYLSIRNVSKKWNMPIHDWKLALNRFSIMFPERFPETLMI